MKIWFNLLIKQHSLKISHIVQISLNIKVAHGLVFRSVEKWRDKEREKYSPEESKSVGSVRRLNIYFKDTLLYHQPPRTCWNGLNRDFSSKVWRTKLFKWWYLAHYYVKREFLVAFVLMCRKTSGKLAIHTFPGERERW